MPDLRPNISATADTFIHYLFASIGNEHILLSFINAVRENVGLPPLKEAHVLSPFNPKTFVMEKLSIIDIKAVAEDNHTFVIEFQVAKQSAFAKRALYYWAKTFSSQLLHGEDYETLSPVTTIVLTRFLLFGELEKLHNMFQVTAKDHPEILFTDDLQIHTLELDVTKLGQLPAIKKPLRQWLEFFYYADKKSEEEMKALLENSGDPAISQAYDAYQRFNQDAEMRHLEDMREMYLHDMTTEMNFARAEGEARGEVKGEVKGAVNSILMILEARFGNVPVAIRRDVTQITDLTILGPLTVLAAKCESLDEFSAAVK